MCTHNRKIKNQEHSHRLRLHSGELNWRLAGRNKEKIVIEKAHQNEKLFSAQSKSWSCKKEINLPKMKRKYKVIGSLIALRRLSKCWTTLSIQPTVLKDDRQCVTMICMSPFLFSCSTGSTGRSTNWGTCGAQVWDSCQISNSISCYIPNTSF